jgi:protein TonB
MAPATEDQMFNNLIESSSHRSEFKRRGSFFLFTTISYALLFIIAGVISIYAYDARMEDQNLEIVTMMPLVDLPRPEPPKITTANNAVAPKEASGKQSYFERRIPIADVDHPLAVPDKVSTAPNPDLPMPKEGVVVFNGRNSNPSEPGNSDSSKSSGGNAGASSQLVTINETPPSVVAQQPVPKVIRKKIINSEAISLPKPPYPPMAKQLRVQGVVTVQVLIDETGKVVSAKAISGNSFLVNEAQKAAYQARFSPTFLGDQPVKVSGVITYNFLLQ